MVRRGWLIVVTGAVALASFAGAAQITREESDALSKKVRDLEAKVALLDVQVKRLDRAPQRPAAMAAGQLQGRDLQAWKLARKAAEDHQADLMQPRNVSTGPPAAVEAGTAGAYRAIVGHYYDAMRPDPLQSSEPLAASMQKNETGDYYFWFRRVRTPGKLPMGLDAIRVRVTDYETVLRVEEVVDVNL